MQKQQHPRTRRVQRIHLPEPLRARLGSAEVILVDVSTLGARIEHHVPLNLANGSQSKLVFIWEDQVIEVPSRIVRSRLERFSIGADGLTVYHSGLEFVDIQQMARGQLKELIGTFITRALEEQKLNAYGVAPQHEVSKMPIFRQGQLTSNSKDVRDAMGEALLPSVRLAKESGYVCYQLDRTSWRKKRTHDPGQPEEGFTISALEDLEQAELLCKSYEKCDRDGRQMIQLFAQLSIIEGEGVAPGRFDP